MTDGKRLSYADFQDAKRIAREMKRIHHDYGSLSDPKDQLLAATMIHKFNARAVPKFDLDKLNE